MPSSGFICRPCLALIRKQQLQALAHRRGSQTQTLHLSRGALAKSRTSILTALHSARTITTSSAVSSTGSVPSRKPDKNVQVTADTEDIFINTEWDAFEKALAEDSKEDSKKKRRGKNSEFDDILAEADARWDEFEKAFAGGSESKRTGKRSAQSKAESELVIIPAEGPNATRTCNESTEPSGEWAKLDEFMVEEAELERSESQQPDENTPVTSHPERRGRRLVLVPEFDDLFPKGKKQWEKLEATLREADAQRVAMDPSETDTIEGYKKWLETEWCAETKREAEKKLRIRWSFWFLRFHKMGLPHNSLEAQIKNIRRGSSGILFAQLRRAGPSVEDIRAKWMTLNPATRSKKWPSIMSKALRYAYQDLPPLLEATYERDPLRGYIVRDVLRFLSEQIQGFPRSNQQPFADAIASAFIHVLRNSRPREVRVRQVTIFNIIKFASVEKLRELLHELKELHHPIRTMTKLHFADRLAKAQDYRMESLDLMTEMVQMNELDINSTLGAALSTALLSIPNTDPGGRKGRVRATLPPDQRVRIYETLLNLGLDPNIINFTAILQNLCEGGELGTAWDVYALMEAQGFVMDGYVYSVLLRGSKIAEDFVSSGRVIEKVKQARMHDPIIWNDCLHNIFWSALTYTQKAGIKPPRVVPVFPTMLTAYRKFFDTEPLQRLMSTDLKEHTSGLSSGFGLGHSGGPIWPWVRQIWPMVTAMPNGYEILQPRMDTLFIMLLGYIKGFSKPYSIIAFYSHFRNLLKSGDPLTVQFVQETGPMLYNVIIKSLCEYNAMLRVALDVLSDMLKDAPDHIGQGEQGSTAPTQALHAVPDVYTWSILLNGFMFHKQLKQGERILQMMREHGITPNTATWNQLLQGYARAQKPGKVASVLQRIEKAGVTPDEFTTRAFSHLQNQEHALQLMGHMALRRERLKKMNKKEGDLGRLYTDEQSDDGAAANEYRQLEQELGQVSESMIQLPMEHEKMQMLAKEVNGVWSVKTL